MLIILDAVTGGDARGRQVREDALNLHLMYAVFNSRAHVFQTHHTLDDLILPVVLLHLEEVVAEVKDVKASLLSQQGDDHAACPVEAVSKALPGGQEEGVSVNIR